MKPKKTSSAAEPSLDAVEPSLDAVDFRVGGVEYRYVAFDRALPGGPPELTEAELDVARRAANGESQSQIGEARGTSVHTVANQLASVFSKLGISSRHELVHALQLRASIPPR